MLMMIIVTIMMMMMIVTDVREIRTVATSSRRLVKRSELSISRFLPCLKATFDGLTLRVPPGGHCCILCMFEVPGTLSFKVTADLGFSL